MQAVFLMDEPELIPRHNTYEFLWFLRTGYARYALDYELFSYV